MAARGTSRSKMKSFQPMLVVRSLCMQEVKLPIRLLHSVIADILMSVTTEKCGADILLAPQPCLVGASFVKKTGDRVEKTRLCE
mmetsp:Transcript_124384/g.194867  ORF Transcript_124384/g.194867 Transcript_124384/m.194867 type:complete len:84 (+) Transcript_124384:404-655(+)